MPTTSTLSRELFGSYKQGRPRSNKPKKKKQYDIETRRKIEAAYNQRRAQRFNSAGVPTLSDKLAKRLAEEDRCGEPSPEEDAAIQATIAAFYAERQATHLRHMKGRKDDEDREEDESLLD